MYNSGWHSVHLLQTKVNIQLQKAVTTTWLRNTPAVFVTLLNTLNSFFSFLFLFFFFFKHVGLLIPEISCGLVRNSSRFFQHVIPLETMLKGQSPGQLPGRYTLHDCWEIEPFGCIFCLFGGHFTVIIVGGGVAVYSSNNKMGQFKLWMLKNILRTLS